MENNSNSSCNTFSDLKITTWKILEQNGFRTMTDIQKKTIPILLSRKDAIVHSHTGSGKTLSFVIPIVEDILQKNYIRAVIISPTRELAIQTQDVLRMFPVQPCCFIGGIEIERDLEAIKNCNVVVGTPGRLFEIIKKNPKLFSKVSSLVLDEADELVSLGFSEKVLDIISLMPKKRNTSLFSATITEGVQKLSLSLLRNPISIDNLLTTPEELTLKYLEVLPEDKLRTTLELVEGRKSIVFFGTCNQVEFFHSLISKFKDGVLKIHGKMKQEERSSVYKLFDSNKILLCTDVAARGIDFKDIERIIHFDVPKEYSTIIHRSGRTARNGKIGEAILFIMPNEKTYIEYLKIKNISINSMNLENEQGIKTDFSFENNCIKTDQSIKTDYSIKTLKRFMDDYTLDLSVKAFVSYIRSYKEHNLNYILDFQTLDYDSLAELYMLEKIPGMFELKNVKFKKFEKPEEKNVVKKRIDENKAKKIKKVVKRKEDPPAFKRKPQQHKQKRIKSKKDRKRKK
ncbi:ATP-dependent rRNA helicase SPB4 [Nosema granulosis]|uniref:ATP-dependent RNA helicase n=1 Tax=Nosema granulosis TaxID=83296 RepID=A0A9P6KZT6_9MICR|nr:ATP-dependent rRNA helicase SPB4 [Nosema granulosis]